MKTLLETLETTSLSEYINEQLIFESYDPDSIAKEIESTPGFDNSIKFKSTPKMVYAYKFDRTTGELKAEKKLECDELDEFDREEGFLLNISARNSEGMLKSGAAIIVDEDDDDDDVKDMSVYITDTNDKKFGLTILTTSKKNKDIIVDYVANNIDKFDPNAKEYKMTKKEIDTLIEFFEDNVKNVEPIVKNNILSVYFPSRNELKKLDTKTGLSNIPHITISKPNRLKGTFGITVYKAGRWQASEFPSSKGSRYNTVDDVLRVLNKNFINGNWAEDVHAELN